MELTTTGTKNLRADIRKVPQVERLRWIANFFKLCGPIYLLLKGFSQQETLNLYLSLYLFADENSRSPAAHMHSSVAFS